MKIFILLLTMTLTLLAKEATVEQLFSVQTVKVKQIMTHHIKKSYGYVKADDAKVFDISPRFGGYVIKLYANKIYKYVKKGEALVTLYSPEVYKAKEDYLNSYRYTKGKKNKGMLKSAKLKLQLLGVSKGEIAQVLQKKRVSQNTTIYAPTNGYLFAKNITNGSAFNAKNKLFEIVNIDTVWVEAKVFEKDVSWLKNATSFDISVKSTPKTYKATARLLYPSVDPKEATLTLRLRLNNKSRTLFPGMYANILAQDKQKSYLSVPQTAVIRKAGKYYAFIVGEFEGEYEPVEVSVTPLNNEIYIVNSGLSAGEEVVNNALFMMDSDAQINGLF